MDKANDIVEAKKSLNKVLQVLEATNKELIITASVRDHNLRDIVMHLVKWQEILKDKNEQLLPEGYSWDNFQALNQVFHDEAQSISYDDAIEALKKNNDKIISLYENLNDERSEEIADNFALITYKHYPWLIDMIEKSK